MTLDTAIVSDGCAPEGQWRHEEKQRARRGGSDGHRKAPRETEGHGKAQRETEGAAGASEGQRKARRENWRTEAERRRHDRVVATYSKEHKRRSQVVEEEESRGARDLDDER